MSPSHPDWCKRNGGKAVAELAVGIRPRAVCRAGVREAAAVPQTCRIYGIDPSVGNSGRIVDVDTAARKAELPQTPAPPTIGSASARHGARVRRSEADGDEDVATRHRVRHRARSVGSVPELLLP